MKNLNRKIWLLRKVATLLENDGQYRDIYICNILEKLKTPKNEEIIQEIKEKLFQIFWDGQMQTVIWRMFEKEARLFGLYLLIENLKDEMKKEKEKEKSL